MQPNLIQITAFPVFARIAPNGICLICRVCPADVRQLSRLGCQYARTRWRDRCTQSTVPSAMTQSPEHQNLR